MTLFLETVSGAFAEWRGAPIDGIKYQRSIEQKWSAEELAAIGLYAPLPADPIPEGKVATASTVQRVDGAVKWVHELRDAPPPVITVPAVVSMRQARLALLGAGLLSQVDTAIDGMDEPNKSAARIEWEYATELRRDHPLIAGLAAELQLSEQQVDDLFIAASQIP